MKEVKSIKFNFIMNLIRVLMTIVFPLITYPYATRVLNSAGVGRAAYVASIVSYFQLVASFGVNNYAITEGAKIRDDKAKLNKFASEMFFINLVFTVLAYIGFAGALFLPKFDGYEMLLLISSSTVLFTTLGMEWLYELLEEYEYITIRSVIFQVVALVMLFVLVRNEGDVAWYVALTAVSTVGSGVLNFIHSRHYIHLFETRVHWADIKVHMKPMVYMFGVSIASVIYLNSDITMLGWMKGDKDAGIYTTASKMNQVLCTLIKSLSTVIMPRMAYYLENDQKDNFDRLLKQAFRFMMMLIVPCMVGMLLISPEVIHLISGKNYSEFFPSVTTSRILAINLFFSPINGFIAYQIFMPKKKEKIIFWATLGGAISNLIINYLLIPVLSYDGAAIATVLAEAMVMLICIILGHKMIPFKGMMQGVWKYVIASVPMVIAYVLFQKATFNSYLIYMLLMIIIGVVTYGIMLLILGDELVREEVRMIFGKLKHNEK